MQIKINQKITSTKGLLVIPVFQEDFKKMPSLLPKNIQELLKFLERKENFKGKKGQSFSTFITQKNFPEKVMIFGMGTLSKINHRLSLNLGGQIGKVAKSSKKEDVSIYISGKLENFASELIQGIMMSLYRIDPYKSKIEKPPYELKNLELVTIADSDFAKNIRKSKIIAQAVSYVKDLVNAPANKVDAEYLSADAKKIAKKSGFNVKILDEKELKRQKWGAMLAVNQGSAREAKCIILDYQGAKNKNEKPIILVGKGVIFDSGGYNLKPLNFIETMHQDMAGGATVLGLFSALKDLGIKKNIIGIIPIVENMISGKSYRPSDIITTLSGKTVEITNTDAEGRLVLADAITYGLKFKPQYLITVATLTGAVGIALGDRYSGLMGNNLVLRKALQFSGREVDDLGWPLPLHPDFKKKMKSEIADMKNTDLGTARFAGSSKGAAFLASFIGKVPWCHIDIGGTAFTMDPKPYEHKGATAAGLRMLLNFLQK